jgi:hypothetical protein
MIMYPEFEEDLRIFLAVGMVKVTFTKKNGSSRIMRCTLASHLLPVYAFSDNGEEKKEKATTAGVVAVWDTENDGWRSFRIDSITEVVLNG